MVKRALLEGPRGKPADAACATFRTASESKRPGQPGLFHARLAPMKIVEVRHPLVQHKLGLMRRADNSTKTFRELAAEVAHLLPYEATQDPETEHADGTGWAGHGTLARIKGRKLPLGPLTRAANR